MKFFKFTILFLLAAQLCQAQDTTIVLSANMLHKTTDEIYLSQLNGWIFKHANDTGFSKINIDTSGWKQLKPSELSSKFADKNGRIECWFRIKIQLDSSFLNKQIGFDFMSWAATEFYIDGKLVTTRGNTGENGKPFREYNGDKDPVFVHFQSSAPHLFAIHFVGYLSPMPPYRLKSQGQSMLVLIGPNFFTFQSERIKTTLGINYLWLYACAFLSLFFWLLLVQNKQEKNLVWIAMFTTALTLFIYFRLAEHNNTGISFMQLIIYAYSGIFIFIVFILILIPILLIKVFNRKINKKLLLALIILVLLNFISIFIPQSNTSITSFFLEISVGLVLIICFYYVITSWKNLKGAQWAIIFGMVLSISSLIITSILFHDSLSFFYLSQSIFILSFPLSLLVYVSMRFKEIIKEVQVNAKKVVELSEEKKVHAESQQKILQEEVNKQTAELRNTLENLQSTQKQLIQSEKMASLGELTAGIAHEIQNPLNFVNNFSEVNKELLEELKAERLKPKAENDEQTEDEIINDVIDNSEKINYHGKRAGEIVKGMLQHSRSSTGVKEPTDINALADEYLRLSYHGFRAKDKSFNAKMETNFDESIGKINIIPQDIGRVLLNLYNNAFYAVKERQKARGKEYDPTVSVTTKKSENHVIITVSDNGNGIPQKIVDKIFQPFFTTKPTGQGTGLGLSLSYDIVKAHGGEIKVESKEGEGTEFIIELAK